MPTLARFVLNSALFGLVVYGAMFALVTFVAPKQREIVTRVPVEMRPGGNPDAKPSLLRNVKQIQARHGRLLIELENFPFEEK